MEREVSQGIMEHMDYNGKWIRKMQEVQLEIYKVFERKCEEEKLSFFVLGGAALGALRHRGFIPWDDDIDVCMPREDYNRLRKCLAKRPVDGYRLVTPESQDGCVLVFGKFTKDGTEWIEAAHKYRDYKSGVGIDVFPYDKVYANKRKGMRQIRKTWFWNRVMVLTEYPEPVLPSGIPKIAIPLLKTACRAVHMFLRCIGFTKGKAYKKYLKYALACEKEGEKALLTDFSYADPRKVMIRMEETNIIELPFEDTTIKTIRGIRRYLTAQYGDYMALPPEDERYNHPPKYVDFGNGEIFERQI